MAQLSSAFFRGALLALFALLQLNASAQETADLGPTLAQIRKLQQERVTTLEEAVEVARGRYQQGASDFKTVLDLQHDLLDAQLDMAETPEDQIKVIRSQLELTKGALALAEARHRLGTTTVLDVFQAKSAALRVEIKLLRLQASNSK